MTSGFQPVSQMCVYFLLKHIKPMVCGGCLILEEMDYWIFQWRAGGVGVYRKTFSILRTWDLGKVPRLAKGRERNSGFIKCDWNCWWRIFRIWWLEVWGLILVLICVCRGNCQSSHENICAIYIHIRHFNVPVSGHVWGKYIANMDFLVGKC